MRILLGILILLASITLLAEEYFVTVSNPDNRLTSHLKETDTDFMLLNGSGYMQLHADDAQMTYLTQTGYDILSVCTMEELSRELEEFHNYAEVTSELQQYADDYSQIVRLESLGPSQCHLYYDEGLENYIEFQHEIWCLKVSDNPDAEEDEPNVFIGGAIHARELISVEVPMHVLQHILENYGTDDEITQMVDENQIWFVPLINPDGHKLSIEELHLWHRKNMRDNNGNQMPDYSSDDGVDLNRNFGYVWGNHNASGIYFSESYHGPEAWSEPETVYLRDLIRARRFWGAITYHSSGQYVLYPLGHLDGVCSYDHEIMGDLAEDMAMTIPRIDEFGFYTPIQAVDFGYTCQGTMGDWSYSEQRVFGFTIELSNTHFPSENDMIQICQDNLSAALMFIERGMKSTLTGLITDQQGNPLVADVYVEEIDSQAGMTDVEPSRSNELFGRYIRPLLPGSYTVRFEYGEYVPLTYHNVEIVEDEITELNVQFTTNAVQEEVVQSQFHIVNYPNPFNPETDIVLDLPQAKQLSVTLYDIKGRRVRRLFEGMCDSPRLKLHWDGTDDRGKMAASGLYLVRAESGETILTHKILMVQ